MRWELVVSFVDQFPFMASSLVLVALFAGGILAFHSQRRLMFIAGLLSVPFGLYELVFVPEYWTPAFVAGSALGIEDPLFSISTGGLAWLAASYGLRRQDLAINWQPRTFFRRYLGGSGLGVGSTLVLWSLGLPIMTAVLVCIPLAIVVLAWRFPRHHGLAPAGALGFGLLWFLVLRGMLIVSSGFLGQWNLGNLSDFSVSGIPVEELLWAVGYGAVWPRFVAYVLDVRVREECPV